MGSLLLCLLLNAGPYFGAASPLVAWTTPFASVQMKSARPVRDDAISVMGPDDGWADGQQHPNEGRAWLARLQPVRLDLELVGRALHDVDASLAST